MDTYSQVQTWEKPVSEYWLDPSNPAARSIPGPGNASGKAPSYFRRTLIRPMWAVCMHARQSGFGLSNAHNKQLTNKLQTKIFFFSEIIKKNLFQITSFSGKNPAFSYRQLTYRKKGSITHINYSLQITHPVLAANSAFPIPGAVEKPS